MKILPLLICILMSVHIQAQNKLDLANRYYDDYAYFKAIDLYKSTLENDPNNVVVLERIGNCYYNNSLVDEAAIWFKKALKKSKKKDPELLYKYVQCLKSMKKYEDAYDKLVEYKKLSGERINKSEKEANYIKFVIDLNTPKNKYTKTVNLPVNTKYSEFGIFTKDETIYYASTRADTNSKSKVYLWNNEPFLNLYTSYYKFTEDSLTVDSAIKIDNNNLNTRGHESNMIITKDGKTAYFTRDDLKNRKKLNPDKNGTVQLKLYRAKLIENTWQEFEKLPFNIDLYSIGHPSLSPDEKTLYYISDQPGGFGATDIYSVDLLEDSNFGEPVNLGKKINSTGREMFPFVDKNNTLYFSSDAYLNLGLLDIFKSNILSKKEDEVTEVSNLGAPFNSGYDDFGFTINPDTEKGFFSSDRPGGKGSDDVYGFFQKQCKQIINGFVTDELTKEPIPNATVRLINNEGIIVQNITTNTEGFYEFIDVECNSNFIIVGSKDNYRKDEVEAKTSNKNEDIVNKDLQLQPLIIAGEIVINPIYFDYDKDNIREDAAYELEDIVNVLNSNPKMIIKIESHTDSRGKDNYNLKLSDRRANSTKAYIISREIHPSRIESSIGYGESQLLNKCSNRVKCTEEEHQLNRRSKFIITKE